jgi:very-short-patch-repair endonuclease
MERQSAQSSVDAWIADLATRQHGVVAWFQLRDAGISRGLVDFRLVERRLHIVHRGVYAVGHRVLSREGRWTAAVLALGADAVLSHRSAAEHWGMLEPSLSRVVHVTVPGRGARKPRAGIAVHRASAVERTVHDGIPITTWPTTLLDLAASTDQRLLDRAVEGAERARLIDTADIERLLDDSRRGVRALRASLARYDDAPTRSELEQRFLALCADYSVPRPLINQWLEGYEVDFLWPAERLIVETDGLATHATRAALARDHARDAALALAGYRTQRFTWRQVVDTPADVARLVLRLLAERQP